MRLPQRWSILSNAVPRKHISRFRRDLAIRTFADVAFEGTSEQAVIKDPLTDDVVSSSLTQPIEAVTSGADASTRKPPHTGVGEKVTLGYEAPFSTRDRISFTLNGKPVTFYSLFLRDSCQCHMCVDEHSGQKKFETASISPTIKARQASVDENGTLTVQWSNDAALPGHGESTYSADWLLDAARAAYRHEISSSPHAKTFLWNKTKIKSAKKFFSYEDFLQKDTGHFEIAMKQLGSTGLIFLQNVPEEETAIERIAEKIGPLKNTFYGRTWDVKDKPKAENVAYTSHFLGLHMDLLYMKYPPGIQLLHSLQSSCEGGESMFADAFYAASVLWRTAPAAFHDLCTFPITYRYNKGGHYYSDTKPTIELDPNHPPQINTRMPAIRNINWSPPFQGPLTVDRGHDDFARKLYNYHSAAKAFHKIINDNRNQFTHRLAPGECVIFNNRRVLHGRQKFQSGTGMRWLKGAYLDMDDFASTLNRAYGDTGATSSVQTVSEE